MGRREVLCWPRPQFPVRLTEFQPAFLPLSQGVHESGGPSLEYYQLERLVELVVSPYLCNVLHNRSRLLLGWCCSLSPV